MTTLYHGTSIESAKSIVDNGFMLSDICSSRGTRDFEGACIYGFEDRSGAEDFALNNAFDDHAVIAFEVDGDMIKDDEYDDEGGAYIVTGAKNARIIWTHDNGEQTFFNENTGE